MNKGKISIKTQRKEAYNRIKLGESEDFERDFSIAVDHNVNIIKHVPEEKLTEALCVECVEKMGGILKYVPNHLRTATVCAEAVRRDISVLAIVPKHLQTDIVCALLNERSYRSYGVADYVTIDVYRELLDRKLFSDEYYRAQSETSMRLSKEDDFLYARLRNIASKFDESSFDFSLIKSERDEKVRWIISSEYNAENNTFDVVEKYFNRSVTRQFYTFEEYYLYVEGNTECADFTDFDFEGFDFSKYEVEKAYLPSRVLKEQRRYFGDFYQSTVAKHHKECDLLPQLYGDTVLQLGNHNYINLEKLHPQCRRIFYITDIHMDHRLRERFPEEASYDEVRLFIKKYIRRMLSYASGFGYSLLIGGDVSFDFEISKIFYTELRKAKPGANIYAVLGNHEMWGYNIDEKVKSNRSIDFIISRYRKMLEGLKIIFLNNSLCIDGYTVLGETKIMDMTVDQLRDAAKSARTLVFGTTGFSGYNPQYNAEHGLYRETIQTIDKDQAYSKRSEKVYLKLKEAFPKNDVIVLSHMPLSDWCKDEPYPKWIYVNGHTHHNSFVRTERCTVYADNQMGYNTKTPYLKFFECEEKVDIFRYYADGIHQITKDQYMEGRFGYFKAEVPYMIMLKRGSLYMFIVHGDKDKLFLMDGGQKRTLKNKDITYYYDNMMKYEECIKQGMRQYNAALKRISEAVKMIGGSGYIHGSIVDIDFYNHILLDPNDGISKPYYSPMCGTREEYSNVDKLLEEKLPDMYQEYKKVLGEGNAQLVALNGDEETIRVTKEKDYSIYRSSGLMKKLQYVTEDGIIRLWDDEFIENYDRYMSDNSKMIEQ